MKLPPAVRVVEDSKLAKLAAWKLQSASVALVLGNTIHLYGVSTQEFLAHPNWVRHELKHVEQYSRLGWGSFLLKYVWYSIRFGYFRNPLEAEARAAENEIDLPASNN